MNLLPFTILGCVKLINKRLRIHLCNAFFLDEKGKAECFSMNSLCLSFSMVTFFLKKNIRSS